MTLEQLRAVAHAALIWFVCYLLIPAAEMERVSEQRHFGTIVYVVVVVFVVCTTYLRIRLTDVLAVS